MLLPQVNTTDLHAGELYMLADDPREDKNVYKDIFPNMTMKMAQVSDVS